MGRRRGRTSAGVGNGGAPASPASASRGLFGSRVRAALLVSLLPLFVSPLEAQSSEDLRRAAARLRSVQSALQPLPDSGIDRDVGEIAIVEHDGSSYDDRLPDGTLNYEARTRVGRRFYETHPRRLRLPGRLHELRVQDERRHRVPPPRAQRRRGNRQGPQRGTRRVRQPVPPQGLDRHGRRDPLPAAAPLPHARRPRLPQDARRPRPRDGPPVARRGAVQGRRTEVFGDLLGADEAHWSYLLDSDASFLYGSGLAGQRGRHLHRDAGARALLARSTST